MKWNGRYLDSCGTTNPAMDTHSVCRRVQDPLQGCSVLRFMWEGWPTKNNSEDLHPYFSKMSKLSAEDMAVYCVEPELSCPHKQKWNAAKTASCIRAHQRGHHFTVGSSQDCSRIHIEYMGHYKGEMLWWSLMATRNGWSYIAWSAPHPVPQLGNGV